MLLHHVERVLGRIARLLIGSSLLEDMGRKNIADIVGTVGKQSFDDASARVGIVDAVALDR